MEIVVTGSIAYDYLMRFPGSFRQNIKPESMKQISLSFLVEEMTKHWGGVGGNIAFTMAKLGVRPHLMATVGRDFGEYRQWLEAAGVNTDTVRQHDDVFTASFFCNTDTENNQLASFYSGAMAKARDYALADLPFTPDLVIISPNDPAAMTNYTNECRARGLRFVYDPSQQIAWMDGDTIRHDMEGAYAMVVNQYESMLIADKAGLTIDDLRQMVELLVITHGKEGSEIFHNGDQQWVPVYPTDNIVDPTGAGDAFRAGFLTGIVRGLPLDLAGKMGSLSAVYALENVGPQNPQFTLDNFITRFRLEYDDQGKLEVLRNLTIA
jgi:adenosine kinase